MNEQYPELVEKYGFITVQKALVYARAATCIDPESYTQPGFDPHKWVVRALCEAISNGN